MVVFSEDHIQETRRRGRIEVICGSMFSGKTEELIRRLKRAKFARQRVEIFKPAIDTRYSEEEVVSHDSNSIASTPIDSSASILLFSSDKDVVGIDWRQPPTMYVTKCRAPSVTCHATATRQPYPKPMQTPCLSSWLLCKATNARCWNSAK